MLAIRVELVRIAEHAGAGLPAFPKSIETPLTFLQAIVAQPFPVVLHLDPMALRLVHIAKILIEMVPSAIDIGAP